MERGQGNPASAAADESSSQTILFEPVARSERLSDKVADLMLERILADGLKPGDRLPSERLLGEQFGVSRTVIREATRVLAAKGIIDVRAGVGLCVAAVEANAVSSTMRLFVHGSEELTHDQVYEVRLLLEIEATGLAAQRATDEDLAALKVFLEVPPETVQDVERVALLDVEFHRAICNSTHNPLYLIVLDSFQDVLLEIRRATVRDPGSLRKLRAAHQAIFDAVAAHDVEEARDAMRSHLVRSAGSLP